MMRRIKSYIHDLNDWPQFRWKQELLTERLAEVRHRQGRLIGRMESLGFQFRAEAVLQTLTEDVLKSSEIEGEMLDREQVRSSIARRLGMDIGGLTAADRQVEGVVEMMLDATQHYAEPLTEERLFSWHAALFPTARSGMMKITVGAWRDDKSGPMQVVSGAIGKERVHYEAPEAMRLKTEMDKFLEWFNKDDSMDLVLKAGIAHLWFVTIHPFDDGNGRIARAIADMALARSEKSAQRFYSMSAQIRQESKAYYEIFEATQKADLERLRRKPDIIQMGETHQVLSRHGAARYRGPPPKGRPGERRRRGAKHQLLPCWVVAQFAGLVHLFVATRAQCDQILFFIAARSAAEFEMVYLQVLHAAACLAS